MSLDGKQITLDIAGTGIIFHSPRFAEHIKEGEDYLQSSYFSEEQVQSHIQAGTIVGFGTGSPGTYILNFHSGYPEEAYIHKCDFKLRLGLKCGGGVICCRDLYELLDWRAECQEDQQLLLDDGIYHVTLCSNRPASGILGDNQKIDVYLEKLSVFPRLAKEGVPTLCM